SGQFRLTIPNTYSTSTLPASLRYDCCSPSLRNAVRLPSGIDVHLHRNTHMPRNSVAKSPERLRVSAFNELLARQFAESRRKAHDLMSIHEHLPPQVRKDLKDIGWTKG